jgi:hypothetical protein
MIVQKENPAQNLIRENAKGNEPERIGSKCYYYSLSWTALASAQPIPPSFDAGLKDIEQGRVVDLDIALTQVPSA